MSAPASLVVICLCIVLCVSAQTPDQTQTTTSSNGQPIIINTFVNNTNANTNQNINTNTNASPIASQDPNQNVGFYSPGFSGYFDFLTSCTFFNKDETPFATTSRTKLDFVLLAPAGGTRNRCNLVQNTHYKGDLIRSMYTAAAGDCCGACFAQADCNVFVFCARSNGCRNANFNIIPYQSCFLKYLPGVKSGGAIESWTNGQGTGFTSGSVY